LYYFLGDKAMSLKEVCSLHFFRRSVCWKNMFKPFWMLGINLYWMDINGNDHKPKCTHFKNCASSLERRTFLRSNLDWYYFESLETSDLLILSLFSLSRFLKTYWKYVFLFSTMANFQRFVESLLLSECCQSHLDI
jgi:hypothetical protein